MNIALKLTLAAGIGLGSLGTASALPMSGLDPAVATTADVAKPVENVRWVCPPYRRCFWVGGYYGGWHRWGGWHRYGWRRW